MDAARFTQLVTLLLAGGYQERPPDVVAAELDGGVVAEAACDACGHVGLAYRPFTLESSYRAFAVCPVCGTAEEF
jgi:hypothetical protein